MEKQLRFFQRDTDFDVASAVKSAGTERQFRSLS